MTGVVTDITDRREAENTLLEYTSRLKALTRRLMDVQESERRHLSRELHDEIGQALTVLKLNIESAGLDSGEGAECRARESVAIIDRTIQQVRNLALDLRPSMLDDLGLVAALRSFVNRQARRAGLEAEFSAESIHPRPVPDVETACFRIAQEAVTNVLRYARARSIRVKLWREEGELCLSVRDDGAGFDVSEARERARLGRSLGLLGMQERVDLVGGRLEIDSAPGRGTEIRAWFPTSPAFVDGTPAHSTSRSEGGSSHALG
jgi:signal transduction histidine kinase